jgi:hypothetical protein
VAKASGSALNKLVGNLLEFGTLARLEFSPTDKVGTADQNKRKENQNEYARDDQTAFLVNCDFSGRPYSRDE